MAETIDSYAYVSGSRNIDIKSPKRYVSIERNINLSKGQSNNVDTFEKIDLIKINLAHLPSWKTNIKLEKDAIGPRFKAFFNNKYYKKVDNVGVNCGKGATNEEICLAKYALAVANEMDTYGQCYTGAKYALWNAGVINDYKDMPGKVASKAKEYFDAHPEKFKKIDVKPEELKNLPAGKIIIYSKAGFLGHIAITNGNGQEMSDCTDNMEWLKEKGEGAEFVVYELSDGWKYNPETQKLEFVPFEEKK